MVSPLHPVSFFLLKINTLVQKWGTRHSQKKKKKERSHEKLHRGPFTQSLHMPSCLLGCVQALCFAFGRGQGNKGLPRALAGHFFGCIHLTTMPSLEAGVPVSTPEPGEGPAKARARHFPARKKKAALQVRLEDLSRRNRSICAVLVALFGRSVTQTPCSPKLRHSISA